MRVAKVVYRPPEKCYTNILLEETKHGYKLFRHGSDKAFTVIPHSSVVKIEYGGE